MSFWSELCDVGTQTWTKPKQHAEDFIIINDRYAKEDWPKIYYLWIQKIYFGTAGFLNALTNRPKSLSPPRTRKRKDTLSTMDVEPDLKLTSYIGAVVKTIFPVCSFLTCRRSVKRRWGAFNTDSPRSCLLDKIRRHLCDNTLPFQNCLEFGLTGIPVHKRVKKPRFEIFESESYVKNIFTNYVVSINKAENNICFNVLKKSLFMSFIVLKYSEYFSDQILPTYIQDQQQNIDCHWQNTYILNNQQRNIDWHWQYAYFLFEKLLSFGHFCKDVYFIRKKLLYCNGKIKRMIYFKFYKRRTDYPMDIFILKKMYVWSNGRSTCIWNIFAQRITKNGWEFSISCIQCFSLPIRWEILFSRFGKRNNSMIRNYSQYGMLLSLESVCLLWIKKYGR